MTLREFIGTQDVFYPQVLGDIEVKNTNDVGQDEVQDYLHSKQFIRDADNCIAGLVEGLKENFEMDDFFLSFDTGEDGELFINLDVYNP